mgnify:CR=1 FL=1
MNKILIEGALCLLPLLCGAAPAADIPYAETVPVIDGTMAPGEWRDAAILRKMELPGNPVLPAEKSEIYLKYDKENLYVAIRAFESNPRGPEAYMRPWNDLLFKNDDAFQLVLGVSDPRLKTRDKIDMGGYAGALDGEAGRADFYYLYFVNAQNARQRQFNEAPLKDALFDSAVSGYANGEWRIEMRIPFAGCGLSAVEGKKILANVFRFRPPEMSGWYLPGFGGYVAMPFGEFNLLPKGSEKPPTREAFRDAPLPKEEKLHAELHYGPLSGAVAAVISGGGKEKLTAELELSGFPKTVQELQWRDGRALVIREFKPGSQPERKGRLILRNASGAVVFSREETFPAVEAPEWFGTDAGSEYIDRKIPAPWTLPEVKGNLVRLVDKELEIGANGLPDAIRRKGARTPLLAKTPIFRVIRNGKELEFHGGAPAIRPDGLQVRVSASLATRDGFRMETRNKIDYDGLMEYKLELSGEDLRNVESLALEIPLAPGVARYLMPGDLVQNTGNLTGAGYRGPAGALWVGNEEEGINFSFDLSPFHSGDRRHQMELRQDAAGDTLVFRFVDARGQLAGTREIFRFFLQPTPTKPYPERPVRSWVTWVWEGWSRWHGYPDLSKTADIAKRVKQLGKENRVLTLYCCQGLQEDAPEMTSFRSDLAIAPAWCYYRFHGKNCFATCKRGPEGDLQLHNYRILIRETGIAGLMSDGLSLAWGDANPLHGDGCGRPGSVSLDTDTPSRIVKQREFLKRMRGLFDASGKPFCLVAHTGGGIDVNTLSFFDAYFEGEQLTRFRRGYYPPAEVFSIAYSGLPWGWRSIYWPKQLHNYNGLDTALAYALLYNSEYYTNPDTEPDGIDTRLLERFAGKGSEFHPFWREHTRIGLRSTGCRASLYFNPKESMIVVSNLGYDPAPYRLDLAKLYPDKTLTAFDLLRNIPIPVDDAALEETLAPFSCRILAVAPAQGAEQAQTPPQTITGGSWDVKHSAGNTQPGDEKLKLKAVPGAPEATATLRDFTFGRNAFVRLKLRANGRIAIAFGNVRLIHDSGWGFWKDGRKTVEGIGDPGVDVADGGSHELLLSVENGKASMFLDGRIVMFETLLPDDFSGGALTLSTWHDNYLNIEPLEISNRPGRISPPPAFRLPLFRESDWTFFHAKKGTVTGDRLVLQAAPEKGAARAVFSRTFGRDLHVTMRVKLPTRFTFIIGTAKISYGSAFPGWGWTIRGNAAPYGRGWIYLRVPLKSEEFAPLEIRLKKGVLNVFYDGQLVISDLALVLPPTGNVFGIETWHTDCVEAEAGEIATELESDRAFGNTHPVETLEQENR